MYMCVYGYGMYMYVCSYNAFVPNVLFFLTSTDCVNTLICCRLSTPTCNSRSSSVESIGSLLSSGGSSSSGGKLSNITIATSCVTTSQGWGKALSNSLSLKHKHLKFFKHKHKHYPGIHDLS